MVAGYGAQCFVNRAGTDVCMDAVCFQSKSSEQMGFLKACLTPESICRKQTDSVVRTSLYMLPPKAYWGCSLEFLLLLFIFHSSQCSLCTCTKLFQTSVKVIFFFFYLPPARPQPTSRPLVPQKHVQARQVLLSWEPGSDGLSPVRYYTVQLRELPDKNWTVHSASVNHEAASYIVSR